MSEPEIDKKLEIRLFELLEERARIRLGTLVQLRRRSRSRGVTLLQVALEGEHLSNELGAQIAAEAGIAAAPARPLLVGGLPPPLPARAEPVAPPAPERAPAPAAPPAPERPARRESGIGFQRMGLSEGAPPAGRARREGARAQERPYGEEGGLRRSASKTPPLQEMPPPPAPPGQGRSAAEEGQAASPSRPPPMPVLRSPPPLPGEAPLKASPSSPMERPTVRIEASASQRGGGSPRGRATGFDTMDAMDDELGASLSWSDFEEIEDFEEIDSDLDEARPLRDPPTLLSFGPPGHVEAQSAFDTQLHAGPYLAEPQSSASRARPKAAWESLKPAVAPVRPSARPTEEGLFDELEDVLSAGLASLNDLDDELGFGVTRSGSSPARVRGGAQAPAAQRAAPETLVERGGSETFIERGDRGPGRGGSETFIERGDRGPGRGGSETFIERGDRGLGRGGSETFIDRHGSSEDLRADALHHDTPPALGLLAGRGSAREVENWSGDTIPPEGAGVDEDDADLSMLEGLNAGERYILGNELGRGGMGQVIEAHDLALDRPVAIKLMNEPEDVALQLRFIDEARVTGQLQHPAIPPVYELGRLGDGRPFFAMRRIEGRTLRDLLEDLRSGDPQTLRDWGRVRLMTIFAQVCRAIAYAHSRDLMHRDLKPDNIMLGEFGEVTVMDWGLAKSFGAPERPGGIAMKRTDGGRFSTQLGELTGTPQYMSPEQAAGQVEAMGAHTDIYALGALLYELLCLEPPYDGRSPKVVREAVLKGELVPPSVRAPQRDIPHDFEQLCLHCLCKEPAQRPSSALYVAQQIEGFLEGEQDRARKEAERAHWMHKGQALATQLEGLQEAHRQLQVKVSLLRARMDPWEDGDARSDLWAVEDAEREARLAAARVRSEALAAFHAALGIDGDHPPAKAALADLYWATFEAAERDKDVEAQAHAETLVRAFDEAHRYTALLAGDGALTVEGLAPGLETTLYRIETRDRVQVPTETLRLEGSPPSIEPLPMGSYLLEVSGPGLMGTRIPLHVGRQESLRLRPRVFPDHIVGQGFVHVAAGPARLGGDTQAALVTPPRVVEIDDFFIARQPVTAGAYAVFLRDLARMQGPHAAEHRAPRSTPRGISLWPLDFDGVPVIPESDTQGLRWEADWPVVCISSADAEAYCAWLSQQTGQSYRLPTDEEWEKSARGADGRAFPWGDTFEPTFCHMGVSRSGLPRRGPSGRFPTDRSPYGVQDLAGGVSEWTATGLDPEGRYRVTKGGHWASGPIECRAASRVAQPSDQVLPTLGFRLARDAR